MLRTERYDTAVETILKAGGARSYTELAQKLGMNDQGLRDLRKGNKKVTYEHADDLSKFYPKISREWLLGDDVPMESRYQRVTENIGDNTTKEATSPPVGGVGLGPMFRTVPFLDIVSRESFVSTFTDNSSWNDLPPKPVYIPPHLHDYAEPLVEIQESSDGMSPMIMPGDYVLATPLDPSTWKDLPAGLYIFLIDGELITRKTMRRPHLGTVTLTSANPKYKSEDIRLEDCKEILRVVNMNRTFYLPR